MKIYHVNPFVFVLFGAFCDIDHVVARIYRLHMMKLYGTCRSNCYFLIVSHLIILWFFYFFFSLLLVLSVLFV